MGGNLVSDMKGGTQTGGVWKQGASRLFEPKRDEENGENCIMKIFMVCTLRQV
jgi:hypothetical protein